VPKESIRKAIRESKSLLSLIQSIALADHAHFFVLRCSNPLHAHEFTLQLQEMTSSLQETSLGLHTLSSNHTMSSEHLTTCIKRDILNPLLRLENTDSESLIVIDISGALPNEKPSWAWFFQRLNELRNRLMETLPGALLLILPDDFVTDFRRWAPDFWSIKSDAASLDIPIEGSRDHQVEAVIKTNSPPTSQALLQRHIQKAREGLKSTPNDTNRLYLLASLLCKSGDVAHESGKTNNALSLYMESKTILSQLSARETDNFLWKNELSLILDRIGDIHFEQEQYDKAEKLFHESLSLIRDISNANPEHTEFQRNHTISLDRVGDTYIRRGQIERAFEFYRQSLDMRERLLSSEPERTHWLNDLSISYYKIGQIHTAQGKTDAALDMFTKSLKCMRQLVSHDSDNVDWQRELALSLDCIGELLIRRGEANKSIVYLLESLDVKQKILSLDPTQVQWQRDLFATYSALSNAHQKTDIIKAKEYLEKAHAIIQHLAQTHPQQPQFYQDLMKTEKKRSWMPSKDDS